MRLMKTTSEIASSALKGSLVDQVVHWRERLVLLTYNSANKLGCLDAVDLQCSGIIVQCICFVNLESSRQARISLA